MRGHEKIRHEHLARKAYVYVRQSSPGQVLAHPESGRRQRELETMVARWGWPPSSIQVLDEDQGKSGQAAGDRQDFKRIVGDVSVGEVGIVVGLEVSRLARNNADWFPLIEMCALTRTLVADEEGIYDPNDPNDRLVLGIKGTLSEAELVRIRARLQGARWSLAHRGQLRRQIPTGYVWDERGRVVLDPDERVRSAIRDLFARFEQVGSACGAVRSYARDGLLFPAREAWGRWSGPVRWRAISVRQANRILHNPFYAGVYFYGERRAVTILDPQTRSRKTIVRHQPPGEWEVFLQEAHPGYITYERFVRNQERLRDNCLRNQGPGVVRSGAALVQGIVYCGRCDRPLHVRYRSGRPYPVYVCDRLTSIGGHVHCMSVPVQRVDRWVEQQVLEAVAPLGLEAALEAVAELERRSEELKRQWRHRLEQAEYEAALARRRYEAVDPDNRLVAGNLEREWEEKLRSAEALRQEYADRSARPPMRISEEDRQRLRQLAADLPALWHAKTTKPSDRARVVRILIRDVWLSQEDEPRRTRVRIHWQTGAVTEGLVARPLPACAAVRTPQVVVERLRELWASCRSAEEIAQRLNREGLRSGRSKPFTARRVKYLLRSRNIADAGEDPQK